MSVKWARVEDTTWPVDVDTDDEDSLQWRLRYGGDLTREDRLSAASILSSYAYLQTGAPTMAAARESLRRCRKAANRVLANRETTP